MQVPLAALTNDEARWLKCIQQDGPVAEIFSIPPGVHSSLVKRGLLRWISGELRITLEGLRALARHERRFW